MDVLVSWDKALFLWLNGMGTETFDSFWMLLTNRGSNISLYLFLWLFFWVQVFLESCTLFVSIFWASYFVHGSVNQSF